MVALWQELLIHNLFVAAAHLLLGRCAQQQGKWGCQNSLPKAEEYEKQKKTGTKYMKSEKLHGYQDNQQIRWTVRA